MIERSRRRLRHSVGTASLLIVISSAAHAQIFEQTQQIDQYLNPLVYGTDIQPGVTVTTRLHPDYDPLGVRVGQFVILTRLTESFGYDDNVTGLQNGRGSPLINTAATVNALNTMSDGSIAVQGNLADYEYLSASQQSFTTYNASVTGTHKFGEDLLTVSLAHYNMEQTPRDLDVPQLSSPIAYRFEDLQASYAIAIGRWQLQPTMDISYYNFDNGVVAGQTLLQSYRDRIVYYPSFTARYEFATRRDLLLVVRDADASYTNAVRGLPTQDFNDVSVLAGLSYDVDGVIGFRLLGGYEERDFSARAYKKIQAPIVEGSVIWTPTDLTTVTGTAARYITDTSAEGTIGETETTIKLSVDHELLRNVIVTGKAGFSSAEYFGGRASELYTVGGTVTWKLNRLLRLGLDYRFTDRQSPGGVPQQIVQPSIFAFGQSYTENVVRLQLGVAF
jgi:hypothetical protein